MPRRRVSSVSKGIASISVTWSSRYGSVVSSCEGKKSLSQVESIAQRRSIIYGNFRSYKYTSSNRKHRSEVVMFPISPPDAEVCGPPHLHIRLGPAVCCFSHATECGEGTRAVDGDYSARGGDDSLGWTCPEFSWSGDLSGG